MVSLILKMSISLDGYLAPPDVGAATYTEWATYWPGDSGPLAEPMNELTPLTIGPMTTAVFSDGAVAHVFAAHS